MKYKIKVYCSGPHLVLSGKGQLIDVYTTGNFETACHDAFHTTNEDLCYTVIIENTETGNKVVYHNGGKYND